MNDDPSRRQPEAGAPTDEELRAALEEQMRRITVDDVLVQTAVTLINLGGRRLGLPGPEGEPPEGRDLVQARKAIDAVRALLPLLPPEPQGPIRDAASQLQIAFAREAQGVGEPPEGAGPPSSGAPGEGPPGSEGEPPRSAEDAAAEAERARARAKIWTPPGT